MNKQQILKACLYSILPFLFWAKTAESRTAQQNIDLQPVLNDLNLYSEDIQKSTLIKSDQTFSWTDGIPKGDLARENFSIQLLPNDGYAPEAVALSFKGKSVTAESCTDLIKENSCKPISVKNKSGKNIIYRGSEAIIEIVFFGNPCKDALTCKLKLPSWTLQNYGSKPSPLNAFSSEILILQSKAQIILYDLNKRQKFTILDGISADLVGKLNLVELLSNGRLILAFEYQVLVLDFPADAIYRAHSDRLVKYEQPLASSLLNVNQFTLIHRSPGSLGLQAFDGKVAIGGSVIDLYSETLQPKNCAHTQNLDLKSMYSNGETTFLWLKDQASNYLCKVAKGEVSLQLLKNSIFNEKPSDEIYFFGAGSYFIQDGKVFHQSNEGILKKTEISAINGSIVSMAPGYLSYLEYGSANRSIFQINEINPGSLLEILQTKPGSTVWVGGKNSIQISVSNATKTRITNYAIYKDP